MADWRGGAKVNRAVLPFGAAALLVAGLVGVASAGPDRCGAALDALGEQRAGQVGLRAAYAISVRNGYEGHVARLGPNDCRGSGDCAASACYV